MAKAKAKAKKKTAAKRAPSPAVISRKQERDWQRQDDLRVLRQAAEIQSDPRRLAGAKNMATKEMNALKKVAGPRKT